MTLDQDADDVTVGAIIPELERAQTRSKIAREIGRELATRTAVATMFDGL